MFQFPTLTVLLTSLVRLLMYLGLCNKEEDLKPRICELDKLAVSGAEGGILLYLYTLTISIGVRHHHYCWYNVDIALL